MTKFPLMFTSIHFENKFKIFAHASLGKIYHFECCIEVSFLF